MAPSKTLQVVIPEEKETIITNTPVAIVHMDTPRYITPRPQGVLPPKSKVTYKCMKCRRTFQNRSNAYSHHFCY